MWSEAFGVLLLPLVLGVVEVAKRAGVPRRLLPLLALVLGVGLMGAVIYRPDAARVVVWGVTLGLSAMGLYSGGKAVIGR